jgi:DNA polymerase-4
MVARLRHTVFSWLRVSFSAGIAANKTVARIAARLRKPAGQSVVPPGSEQSFLAPLPVQLLEGLGRQSREVLELAGVRSLGALAAAPLDALQLALGKQARHWQLQAQGVDESPVRPRRTLPHAFRETIEFPEEAFEHAPVLAQLRVALERILAATRAQNVEPRRLTLTLRYTDREESTHSTSLAQPSNLEWDWDPTLPALLRNGWRRRVRLRAMTLAASLIYSPSPQLSLFSEPRRESGALLRLATSMDEIRRKYGQGVIHRGWKGLH